MARPSIAFASHELWPFVPGGGIGRSVWASATLLRDLADVTVITSDTWKQEYRALASDDPRTLPGVRMLFAAEPAGNLAPLRTHQHAWSQALFEALHSAYPDGGPDVVEFNDYWGEGAMTVEARRSGDPFLRDTIVAIRTRTTHEMTSVLNGGVLGELERTLHGLERCSLRGADAAIWPGGDVWATYQRFYGAEALAPALLVPEVFMPAPPVPTDRESPPAGPLRLLYFGRLERRKGVEDLVQAVVDLDADDVRVTLVGGDTNTAPGGGSMRARLKSLADGDERLAFHDRVPHEELAGFIRSHHVVVSPSRWESWSNVVREALAGNRPVLATPVGGVVAAIEHEQNGWLTDDASAPALRAGIERLRHERAEIDRMISAGSPRTTLERMLEHDTIVASYLELARSRQADERAARTTTQCAPAVRPLTALVAYGGRSDPVARTLASLRSSGVPVRVVLASVDGMPPLRVGEELADALLVDPTSSRQDALRAALDHGQGDVVLLLDAREDLDPRFIRRGLAALHADPALAYVSALPATAYAPAPLPNAAAPCLGEAIGSGPMLVRRSDLDAVGLPQRPDGDAIAALAVALAARNRWGTVIPEPLVRASAPRAPLPPEQWLPARTLPPVVWRRGA